MTPARSEELLKSWDDVRDRFNDVLKRPINGSDWHTRIAERYINGCLTLHLHVVGQWFGATLQKCLSLEFCNDLIAEPGVGYTFEVPGDRTRNGQLNLIAAAGFYDGHTGGSDFDAGCVRTTECEQRETVLVSVYQLVEGAKQRVPSLVRL